MNSIKKFLNDEPVVSAATLAAAVAALINLLVAFGVPVTPDQAQAIQEVTAVFAPVLGIIAAFVARKFVFTQRTLDDEYTHDDEVLEYEQDGHVLAGEANELPTNTHVREVGDLDESV